MVVPVSWSATHKNRKPDAAIKRPAAVGQAMFTGILPSETGRASSSIGGKLFDEKADGGNCQSPIVG